MTSRAYHNCRPESRGPCTDTDFRCRRKACATGRDSLQARQPRAAADDLICAKKEPNYAAAADLQAAPTLQTLPGDDVRQSCGALPTGRPRDARASGAHSRRGPVARLVAAGARNSHEWTPAKASLLPVFDESGITAAFWTRNSAGSSKPQEPGAGTHRL